MNFSTRFLASEHPLWLAGFRPFFVLALLMGILLPSLWAFIFSGALPFISDLNPLQWHAHEMFFGFGGAVLFGFLLTASKNWVKVRGIHGFGLICLTGLWILERLFFYPLMQAPPLLKHIGLSLFPLVCGIYIAITLIKYRKNDSFKDNYFFLILLTFMVVTKNLLISVEYYQHGIALAIGLFRLAFAVMFERTMTQFMKSTENVTIYKNLFLDLGIKLLVLLSVFQSFLPPNISAIVLILAAMLLFLRWILWRPDLGFKKFGNATMYIGYLGLILHFVFEAVKIAGLWSHGTISTHIFTFLCMGVVIPSMMVRISQGHTGRKPKFTSTDKIAIFLILTSSFFRLLFPFILPAQYLLGIQIAGLLWTIAFIMLSLRLWPFLFQARIDGKAH